MRLTRVAEKTLCPGDGMADMGYSKCPALTGLRVRVPRGVRSKTPSKTGNASVTQLV